MPDAATTTPADFAAHPRYGSVFLTFVRNSLVREMTFRASFIITVFTQAFWFAAQVMLFGIIYSNVGAIDDWTREEYFAFMATGMLINAIVEMFFMPNCANFSELIRTGNLDFALLKPIDAQFLISFQQVNFAMIGQTLLALGLLGYSLGGLGWPISAMDVAMYLLLVGAGVTFFYSLMLILASTSILFGRNQGLYDFWFYVTVFARYPMSIYSGSVAGEMLRFAFAYVIPILLVVTVPARVITQQAIQPGWLTGLAVIAALLGLVVSRIVFHWSLKRYRSASS